MRLAVEISFCCGSSTKSQQLDAGATAAAAAAATRGVRCIFLSVAVVFLLTCFVESFILLLFIAAAAVAAVAAAGL